MNLADITPLILTYNEAPNMPRTLAALAWARQIVVVDSGSTDGTLDILAGYPAVTVLERKFDNFAAQCNYGQQQVATPWTLSIDADYVCGDGLDEEITALDGAADAYAVEFIYAIFGRPLRGTLYPPRPVLFRTRKFEYVQDGHAHKLRLGDARCDMLRTKVEHDDRKPLARWLASQSAYAKLEAAKLLGTPKRRLSWKDRLRRGIVWAPPLAFVYCLVGKQLLLDGWPGIYYSLQRAYAELALSLELLDRRLRRNVAHESDAARQAAQPADARPSPESLESTAP
jgi:glycosyltransferase involved in cell wall biosynthesis